jgi:hypothetical protein
VPPPPPEEVVAVAVGSMVMLPFGVFIVPRWTVQKKGITVPLAAFDGIEKVLEPVNAPVSKEMPLTEPGVKAFWVASLVTEWGIPSSFTTVTVWPGGTCRLSGEYVRFEMVIVKPDVVGGGAGLEVELVPHPATAAANAAAATHTGIHPRMAPSRPPERLRALPRSSAQRRDAARARSGRAAPGIA